MSLRRKPANYRIHACTRRAKGEIKLLNSSSAKIQIRYILFRTQHFGRDTHTDRSPCIIIVESSSHYVAIDCPAEAQFCSRRKFLKLLNEVLNLFRFNLIIFVAKVAPVVAL